MSASPRRLAHVLVAALFGVLVLTGCAADAPEASTDTPVGSVDTVSPERARELIEDGAVVIDVRTPEEFAEGHLADARNIDVQAPSFHEEVGRLDREAGYVLYCRSGARAGAAGQMMAEMGFTDVVNAGGYQSLADAGLPVG